MNILARIYLISFSNSKTTEELSLDKLRAGLVHKCKINNWKRMEELYTFQAHTILMDHL